MPRPTRYRRLRIAGASSDGDTYLVVVTDNLSTPRASGKRVFVIAAGSGPPTA